MFDIVHYLGSLGNQVNFHGNYIQSNCPIHEGSDNPCGFTYWLDNWPRFRCWTHQCHENGDSLKDLIAAILKVPKDDPKIQAEISKYSTDTISGVTTTNYHSNNTNNSVIVEPPKLWWCKELEQFNYTKEFCRKYRVGGVKSRNGHIISIAFLVYDRQGNYCGYTKRLLDWYREWLLKKYPEKGVVSKWKHSRGLKTNRLFYGEKFLPQDTMSVILTEGPRDVLFLKKNGFENVLGTFGLGLRLNQENRLIEWGIDTITIFYDSDLSGLQYFDSKNFKRISSLFNIKVATKLMQPNLDPDDLSYNELQSILG